MTTFENMYFIINFNKKNSFNDILADFHSFFFKKTYFFRGLKYSLNLKGPVLNDSFILLAALYCLTLHTPGSSVLLDICLPGIWSAQWSYFRYHQNKCSNYIRQYLKHSICDDSHDHCMGSDARASDQKKKLRHDYWTFANAFH